MSFLKWLGCSAAALLTILATSAPASAFCRLTSCDGPDCKVNEDGCVSEGRTMRWGSGPLPYRFHAKGSAVIEDAAMRAAVRAAFATWASVRCDGERTSLRFVEEDDLNTAIPEGTPERITEAKSDMSPFGIYFRDERWPFGRRELARTTHKYVGSKSFVTYADIEVNTDDFSFSTDDDQRPEQNDLQYIVAHEIGHYIGIAHSLDPDSIMAPNPCLPGQPRCRTATTKRALSADDVNAVCTYYPPPGAERERVAEPDTASCSSAPARSANVCTLAAAMLACALCLRRRRSK